MSNFNTQHHRTSSIPSYSSANSLLINNHSCCRASVNGVCFTPAPTLVLVSNQLTTSLFRHHQLPFTLEQLLEYQEIYTQLSVLEGTTAATPINDTSISYFQKRIQNLTCTIADKKDKIECLSRKTRTEWNMSTRRKSNTLSYKFTSMIRRSSSSNIIKETIYARGQAVNTDIDRFRETLKQEKSEIQSLADLEVELEGLKKQVCMTSEIKYHLTSLSLSPSLHLYLSFHSHHRQLAKALEKSNTKKLLETRLGIVLNSIFEGPTTPEYPDEDRLEVSLRTLELEYTAVMLMGVISA